MKIVKLLFVLSALVVASGYTFAKGPSSSDELKSSIREKIMSVIESSDIQGRGQVTLRFGISDKFFMQVLDVESNNGKLNEEVKKALEGVAIKFPEGTKGVYQIKLYLNEMKAVSAYEFVRDRVQKVVNNIENAEAGTVRVKLRVINPSKVMVVKAESENKELAQKVIRTLEDEKFYIPKSLNGEYTVNVSFK